MLYPQAWSVLFPAIEEYQRETRLIRPGNIFFTFLGFSGVFLVRMMYVAVCDVRWVEVLRERMNSEPHSKQVVRLVWLPICCCVPALNWRKIYGTVARLYDDMVRAGRWWLPHLRAVVPSKYGFTGIDLLTVQFWHSVSGKFQRMQFFRNGVAHSYGSNKLPVLHLDAPFYPYCDRLLLIAARTLLILSDFGLRHVLFVYTVSTMPYLQKAACL